MTVFDLLMKITPIFNKVKIVAAVSENNDKDAYGKIIKIKGFADDFVLYYAGKPRLAPIILAPREVDGIHVDTDGDIVVMLEDKQQKPL